MGRRVEHEGDITVQGEQVAVTKSTHIKGSMKIEGNVVIVGELYVDGPLVISGNTEKWRRNSHAD